MSEQSGRVECPICSNPTSAVIENDGVTIYKHDNLHEIHECAVDGQGRASVTWEKDTLVETLERAYAFTQHKLDCDDFTLQPDGEPLAEELRERESDE